MPALRGVDPPRAGGSCSTAAEVSPSGLADRAAIRREIVRRLPSLDIQYESGFEWAGEAHPSLSLSLALSRALSRVRGCTGAGGGVPPADAAMERLYVRGCCFSGCVVTHSPRAWIDEWTDGWMNGWMNE